MLTDDEIKKLVLKDLVEANEVIGGACSAVSGDKEITWKWRDGLATITQCDADGNEKETVLKIDVVIVPVPADWDDIRQQGEHMVYEIKPALRTVTIHEAWAVYKDYDGNSPDGPEIAVCATEELADEVAHIFAVHDENNSLYEEDADNYGVDWEQMGWPFSDGHERSAHWSSRRIEAERGKIAQTVPEALKQVLQ